MNYIDLIINIVLIPVVMKIWNELEQLKKQFSYKSDKIKILKGNAGELLRAFCQNTNWKGTRAVVFLDPYGMEVEWDLIENIAKTKAIDMWLLFPLGVGINRLLTKNNLPPPPWSDKLTKIFGSSTWKEKFYSKNGQQMLWEEEEHSIKDTNFSGIKAFFLERLKSIFAGVAENPLILKNTKNNPLYLLCFAAGNPNGAPVAVKIASHILKGKYNG